MISLVVGLGNIGEKYAGTRHNLGFEVVDKISAKWRLNPVSAAGKYLYIEKSINANPIRLIRPMTFMNNSGQAVRQASEYFQVSPNEILVVCDDFNLPLGKIRIRQGGSDGGHNGLASVIFHLETEDFPRLRMGIGPVSGIMDPADFVLDRIPDSDIEIVKKMLGKAVEAVLYSLSNRLERAMSKYNNNNPAPDEA